MDNKNDTDRDQTKREPGEPSLAPSDAFNRALVRHQRATDALGAAIVGCDPRAAAIAASNACAYWLTARAILRRLESQEPVDTARVDLARRALHANHRALLDLFGRAETQIASRELHGLLEQLRTSLAFASSGLSHVGGDRSNRTT